MKGTKPMEKELAQSDITVMRKVPKITQNVNFLRKNSPPLGEIEPLASFTVEWVEMALKHFSHV